MKEVYTEEISTGNDARSDNTGLILGFTVFLVAALLGGLFFFMSYSQKDRAIDAANNQSSQTAAQTAAMQAAQDQTPAEPVVIDRPVVVEVEKPYIVEKEVVREVPAASTVTPVEEPAQ